MERFDHPGDDHQRADQQCTERNVRSRFDAVERTDLVGMGKREEADQPQGADANGRPEQTSCQLDELCATVSICTGDVCAVGDGGGGMSWRRRQRRRLAEREVVVDFDVVDEKEECLESAGTHLATSTEDSAASTMTSVAKTQIAPSMRRTEASFVVAVELAAATSSGFCCCKSTLLSSSSSAMVVVVARLAWPFYALFGFLQRGARRGREQMARSARLYACSTSSCLLFSLSHSKLATF